MSSKLNKAVATIKAGDKQTGKRLLVEVLKTDPLNEIAWLWMTQVVSRREDKVKCLDRVLKINPENEIAIRWMAKLNSRESSNLDNFTHASNVLRTQPEYQERTEMGDRRSESVTKCPFCAETVKVEAKICRFCGRDLKTGQLFIQSQAKSPGVVQTMPQRSWNPGIAAVLSLIIPGAGQMYKGDIDKGILWLVFVIIGYAVFVVPGLILHLMCVYDASSEESKDGSEQRSNFLRWGRGFLFAVLIAGSIMCLASVFLPTVLYFFE